MGTRFTIDAASHRTPGAARMGTMQYSVWIDATPARVWRTYADPTRIPQWQTGRPVIGDVRGVPGEPGSGYVSKRGPLTARTAVVAATAPARLVTRTDAYLGLQFQVSSQFTDRAGGTDLRLTAETHWPPGLRLLGRLLERVVLSGREANKELLNLKELIERESSS